MTKARDNATQGGLVLINKSDFTAASSVSFNNLFTSTYTSYRVITNIDSANNTNREVQIRLRASGTDATSNYEQGAFRVSRDTQTATNFSAGSRNAGVVGYTDPNNTIGCFDIVNPNRAVRTDILGIFNWGISGSWETGSSFFGIRHIQQTIFDGFTIYPELGTFTGSVQIYGYRK